MSGMDLFGTTRGEILGALRAGPRTVNDLADALGLTDNAIRAHLAAMQADGLVESAGERVGKRKPHALFGLTGRAQELFSRLYVPVLNMLLEVLREEMPEKQVESLVRSAGRRLAAPHKAGLEGKGQGARVAAAVGLLEHLGAEAEAKRTAEGTVIRGKACPLAAAVPGHPQVCGLVEAFLAELLGRPVREHCEKGATPRCCFTVMDGEG